jgi:hypothetical protein
MDTPGLLRHVSGNQHISIRMIGAVSYFARIAFVRNQLFEARQRKFLISDD